MARAHSLGRIYATLALNSYEAGDLPSASRYLKRGMAVQREVGECAGCDVLLYPSAVPISIARGELDVAEESCRKAEKVASAFRSRSWVATARYLTGLLGSARGDWQAAALHHEEAAGIFEELNQPYDLARSLEQLARARAGLPAPQAEGAPELLSRAAGLYRELGASFRAERAESLLADLV